MTTNTGARNIEIPFGINNEKKLSLWIWIPKIVIPIINDVDNILVIINWLVSEYVYGIKPNKLQKKIKKNKLKIITK